MRYRHCHIGAQTVSDLAGTQRAFGTAHH
jgi:hypothetical protein